MFPDVVEYRPLAGLGAHVGNAPHYHYIRELSGKTGYLFHVHYV